MKVYYGDRVISTKRKMWATQGNMSLQLLVSIGIVLRIMQVTKIITIEPIKILKNPKVNN